METLQGTKTPELVGADRGAIVDRLVECFDSCAGRLGPTAVSLESSLGLGKTRLVQELFSRLAATRQPPVPYWPPSLDWHGQPPDSLKKDVLQARRQVEPTPGWVIPGRTDIPWLWWGVSCQLTHAGSPMRALKDSSDQLRAHLDPLLAKLERAHRNRDDALEIMSAVFDLTGVVSPGSALDAGAKFLNVFRRRRQQGRQIDVVSMDRELNPYGESYAEAGRIAESLTAVARAGTPVVLAVDDAQWADAGLVSLLRHLIGLDGAPVLIVTTAWPEKLTEQRGRTDTFAHWLETTAATRPERLERIVLRPLDPASLGEIVLRTAPRTPESTVERLSAIASGNPLVLNLLLDLDIVRRDVAADGSIDTNPDDLARLPSQLRAIYQDLWRQLPAPVQRALTLVAVQGPEFLPGFVEDAAIRLGMHDGLVPAFAAARDVHHWVRAVNEDRYEFSERQRFDIADDIVGEVFTDAAQNTVRRAIVDHVLRLKASSRWPDLDTRTRRVALESHLDANERLGEDAERDEAALADTMLQLAALDLEAGNPGRTLELVESALGLLPPDTAEPLLGQARTLLAEATGRDTTSEATAGGDMAAVPSSATKPGPTDSETAPSSPRETRAAPGESGTADEWDRQAWIGWPAHPVSSLTEVRPSEVAGLIAEIVAAEGPVYAGRVYDLLRLASGVSRQGQRVRAALDSGVRSAVRRGDIVASVPDAAGASGRRILRLPKQPAVVLRQLGARRPDQVPRAEIAELARRVLVRHPGIERDELKRRLVPLLGGTVLSKALDETLEPAVRQALAGPEPSSAPEDPWGRSTWVGWAKHDVPPLADLKPAEIAALIHDIVAAEGPVLVRRVYELLRDASGAARLGRGLTDSLDAGVASGVRRGCLVVSPGRRGDPGSRLLRTPEQPAVVLRTPGDRDAATIPASELAALAERVTAGAGPTTREDVKRQIAQILGVGRYTQALDEVLEAALPLTGGSGGGQ